MGERPPLGGLEVESPAQHCFSFQGGRLFRRIKRQSPSPSRGRLVARPPRQANHTTQTACAPKYCSRLLLLRHSPAPLPASAPGIWASGKSTSSRAPTAIRPATSETHSHSPVQVFLFPVMPSKPHPCFRSQATRFMKNKPFNYVCVHFH